MGFWSLFAPDAEELRLLRARAAELERRLFAEIDSNRAREDEMKNALLAALGSKETIGRRTPLAPPDPGPVLPPAPRTLSFAEEQHLEHVVRQFVAQAEERGTPYTEDALILLRKAIREDPDGYLT